LSVIPTNNIFGGQDLQVFSTTIQHLHILVFSVSSHCLSLSLSHSAVVAFGDAVAGAVDTVLLVFVSLDCDVG
jgi:hypothetical protein